MVIDILKILGVQDSRVRVHISACFKDVFLPLQYVLTCSLHPDILSAVIDSQNGKFIIPSKQSSW